MAILFKKAGDRFYPESSSSVVLTPQNPTNPGLNASQAFTFYCASCHSGSQPLARIGLPLEDLSKLKTYVSRFDPARTVQNMLEGTQFQMPPIGAPQPSQDELERMLNAIR
jgi:hypothetical protein